MKLMVQSYNNGGSAYNSEAEETALRSYSIDHRFNQPAEARIVLGDPAGTIAQKYNVDANDVYIGPGKVTIEDPTGTDVFWGRIYKVEADTQSRTVTLYARDFLDQLNDERITLDMREDLDSDDDKGEQGIRQSFIHPDADSTDYIGPAWLSGPSAVADDGGAQTDESAEAASAAANDMTLLPGAPAINDAYYFGWYYMFSSFVLKIGQQGVGNWDITWQYWDGDSWESLSGLTDGTTGFTAAVGDRTVSFTIPGDWAEVAVDGITRYWVRALCSDYVDIDTQPLGTQCWLVHCYVFDDNRSWNADEFNDMYLILTDGMAGEIKVITGPYAYATTSDGEDTNNLEDTWVDNVTDHRTTDLDSDYTLTYSFREMVSQSNFKSAITGARFIASVRMPTADATVAVQVYDHDAAGYVKLDTIPSDTDHFNKFTWEVPGAYLADIFDTDGVVHLQFAMDWDTAAAVLEIAYCVVEIDATTTGYTTPISITDTESNRLKVATDLTAAATMVWDRLPYCIAQPIYKHIDTAELDRIIAGDGLETIIAAATIEHTSGISTRQYTDRTRLEILQDLAKQDKAEFYMALGTATLTYKSTWGANNNSITDATVNSWGMTQDWEPVFNEYNVYGMRIGDRQLHSNVTDATSIAKYKATRTNIVRSSGLVSEYHTNTIATNRAAQDKDVQKMLVATLAGFDTAYRLGIITEVTSSYLGISAVDYIVTGWSYDSAQHLSRISLHPKISVTGLNLGGGMETRFIKTEERSKTSSIDLYVPEPSTHEVS